MKAKNLTVKSFRGINDEISLDLEDFTIISGENGMGKSSFVNSLEYLFVKKLGFLARSTIKKTAYVNENSKKGDVSIELDFEDDEFIRLKGTRKSHSPAFDSILENSYVKNASFIIDRERLLKFIDGTSGNRYKAVMDLLGIKKLDQIQSILSPAIKELNNELSIKVASYERDLNTLEDLINSKNSASQSIMQMKEFNDSFLKDIEESKKQNAEDIEKLSKLKNQFDDECKKFVDDINNDLSMKNLELIDNDTDIEGYKRKLYSSSIFSVDNKIDDFNKAYNNLNVNLKSDLDEVLREYENVASDNLKSSKYLVKTLETSMDYIKLTNSDTCPICNNSIDAENIVNEITQKISQINSSNDAFKIWQKNLKKFLKVLADEIKHYERLNLIVDEINELTKDNIVPVDLEMLSDLQDYLKQFSEFKKQPSDFNIFNFNELYDNVNEVKDKVELASSNPEKDEYIKIIDKLTELNIFKESNIDVTSLDNQIKQREIEIQKKTQEISRRELESTNLERQIFQYEEDIQKIEDELENFDDSLQKIEERVEIAEKTFEIFTETKEEYIDNMLSDIRDDIRYFYDYIHQDDQIMSPDMVVSGAKKIDVTLDSFGDDVDSRSFASEGHLDTLGLCIFLAFNKHFNSLSLMVLDDVLSTVDMTHKERIAKLLMEEFEDYQFIITAHNKNWVDLLENICDESGRNNIVYEIDDWSLEEGPVISQR